MHDDRNGQAGQAEEESGVEEPEGHSEAVKKEISNIEQGISNAEGLKTLHSHPFSLLRWAVAMLATNMEINSWHSCKSGSNFPAGLINGFCWIINNQVRVSRNSFKQTFIL